MEAILEFLSALLVCTLFVVISWGIILRTMDEQKEFDARQDYNKMKKDLKKEECK